MPAVLAAVHFVYFVDYGEDVMKKIFVPNLAEFEKAGNPLPSKSIYGIPVIENPMLASMGVCWMMRTDTEIVIQWQGGRATKTPIRADILTIWDDLIPKRLREIKNVE